jgi:cholesterol transport system auxiliary component
MTRAPATAPVTALAAALAAGLALLLSGCSGLHADRAAPQAYTLRFLPPADAAAVPATTHALVAGKGAPALQVLRPLAAPGLDADSIAVLREGQKLDAYGGARWAGPLPDLVEALAVDALRARGLYRAVQGDAAPFTSEQVLQLELARCAAYYEGSGAPTIQVRIVASFGRRDDRRLLATQVLEASVPAAANRMGAVAAAYELAINAALAQLSPPQE